MRRNVPGRARDIALVDVDHAPNPRPKNIMTTGTGRIGMPVAGAGEIANVTENATRTRTRKDHRDRGLAPRAIAVDGIATGIGIGSATRIGLVMDPLPIVLLQPERNGTSPRPVGLVMKRKTKTRRRMSAVVNGVVSASAKRNEIAIVIETVTVTGIENAVATALRIATRMSIRAIVLDASSAMERKIQHPSSTGAAETNVLRSTAPLARPHLHPRKRRKRTRIHTRSSAKPVIANACTRSSSGGKRCAMDAAVGGVLGGGGRRRGTRIEIGIGIGRVGSGGGE